jgi:hypothetical protein
MNARILDFTYERAKRDPGLMQRLGEVEAFCANCRPYASLDCLPDVTHEGRLAIGLHIARTP